MKKQQLFQEIVEGHKDALAMKKRMIYQGHKLGIRTLEDMNKMQKELEEEDLMTYQLRLLNDNGIDTYEKLSFKMDEIEKRDYETDDIDFQNAVVNLFMFIELQSDGKLEQ